MAKTNEVKIVRAFDHKAFGRIGVAELVADVGMVTINGNEVPASSVEYLLTFALQNLQDAYAGADNADEAKARWQKKFDRLIAGTIGTREAGDGASVEVRTIRTILRGLVKKSPAWAAFKELDESVQNEKLDALYAKQDAEKKAAIDAEVKKRIAEAEAKRKQAAALADAIAVDL